MKSVTMYARRFVAALFAFGTLSDATSAPDTSQQNLKDGRIALAGYDPVSYFTEVGPQKGKVSISEERDGVVYYFSSTENRDRFLGDPDRYEPPFGGWCAWAMLEGKKVAVDPLRYRIYDGKLLLFYDGFWGNTLKKWTRRAESGEESNLYGRAETNWKEILKE